MSEKFRITGQYTYNQKEIPFVGFLTIDGERVYGEILDESADVRNLAVEGKLRQRNDMYFLTVSRRAIRGKFIQNTLSDPMRLILAKKTDGDIQGTYDGKWKFAERCYNIGIGIDESGEKAPVFAEDTHKSGRIQLTLDAVVDSIKV